MTLTCANCCVKLQKVTVAFAYKSIYCVSNRVISVTSVNEILMNFYTEHRYFPCEIISLLNQVGLLMTGKTLFPEDLNLRLLVKLEYFHSN